MECHAFARNWSSRRRTSDWRVHTFKVRYESDVDEWLARPVGAPDTLAVEAMIEESSELLNGSDDEEEAPPAAPVARERAISFLRAHADEARRFGFEFPLPTISVGPNGSVDLHWTLGGFQLLLNFPGDQAQPVTFYGDTEGIDSIKGSIGSDNNSRSLLPWLVQTK